MASESPQSSPEQQPFVVETERFLEMARAWLQEGVRKLSERGVSLQQPTNVVYDPRIEEKNLGDFRSVAQMRRATSMYALDTTATWERLLKRFGVFVSPAAADEMTAVEIERHPLSPALAPASERDLFMVLKPFQVAMSYARDPSTWPSLQAGLMEALWSLVEFQHGFSQDSGIQAGTEKWAVETILGRSTDASGKLSDDSIYALSTRVMGRIVGEVLVGEHDPLQALLKPEVRAQIQARYDREIAPKIEAIHEEYLEKLLSKDTVEVFDWLKRDEFRSFRHQPTVATFCESLRKLGYELLAQDLEGQPEAASVLINGLMRVVERYMEPYRYTPAEVEGHLQKLQEALTGNDVREIEKGYFRVALFLGGILTELGLQKQSRIGGQFSHIAPESVPGDLRPLFEKLVEAEGRARPPNPVQQVTDESLEAMRAALAKILAKKPDEPTFPAIEPRDESEFPEYSEFEQILQTLRDYWKCIEDQHLEDAEGMREAYVGAPYEISVENVKKRLEELRTSQEQLHGSKEVYLQQLEALLAHLLTEAMIPTTPDASEVVTYGEFEQIVRSMLGFWNDFRTPGKKEMAQKFREASVGTASEISADNARARLEELRNFTGHLVGDKEAYLHGLEQLSTYLELEGTEGFY